MRYVGAIAVLVLTPVLWVLSHKYFRFIYFGNIGNAILKEILECFFISLLLVSVFGGVLKTALSGVGTFLLFILKAALIIVGIVLAISLIAWIVKASSAKKRNSDETGACPPENIAEECATSALLHENVTSHISDEEVLTYIKNNFTSSDYVQAIKYYREKTGANFETAKTTVDSLLNSEKTRGES